MAQRENLLPAEGRAASPSVDERLLGLQVDVLRALGHRARLQILQLLQEGERCVCEFEPALGLRQPNISQHLAVLRAANLVTSRRDGLRVMYRVTDPAIYEIINRVTEIVRRQSEEIAEALAQGEPASNGE